MPKHWVQRIDSYLILYDMYLAIPKSLELISTGRSEYGDWSWDSETLTKAIDFLHQLTSSEFPVLFCITMRVFLSLRHVTINLQQRTHDVISA